MSCNWHEIFRLSAWWTDSLPWSRFKADKADFKQSRISHTIANTHSLTLTLPHTHSHSLARPHTHFDGVQKLNYALVKVESHREGGQQRRSELMIGPFAPHKDHNNKRNLGKNPIKCPKLPPERAESIKRRHTAALKKFVANKTLNHNDNFRQQHHRCLWGW